MKVCVNGSASISPAGGSSGEGFVWSETPLPVAATGNGEHVHTYHHPRTQEVETMN